MHVTLFPTAFSHLERAEYGSEDVNLYRLLTNVLGLPYTLLEVIQHLLFVFIADSGKQHSIKTHR